MDLLKPLIALLAIVNPIGAVPFFLAFTQGFSREQRRRTLNVSAFTAFCVISISGLAGLHIIHFFGISIASFQVGGGMLLLISSLHMLNAQPAESGADDLEAESFSIMPAHPAKSRPLVVANARHSPGYVCALRLDRPPFGALLDHARNSLSLLVEARHKADAGVSVAVVPLTIPLLTGPATISTVVIYAEKTTTFLEHAVLVGYGVVIGLATWAAFLASGRIAQMLGRTGINVMTRLMGLILAAMAVELLADGLVKLFPILASPTLRR